MVVVRNSIIKGIRVISHNLHTLSPHISRQHRTTKNALRLQTRTKGALPRYHLDSPAVAGTLSAVTGLPRMCLLATNVSAHQLRSDFPQWYRAAFQPGATSLNDARCVLFPIYVVVGSIASGNWSVKVFAYPGMPKIGILASREIPSSDTFLKFISEKFGTPRRGGAGEW